jgi:hypothetical protein
MDRTRHHEKRKAQRYSSPANLEALHTLDSTNDDGYGDAAIELKKIRLQDSRRVTPNFSRPGPIAYPLQVRSKPREWRSFSSETPSSPSIETKQNQPDRAKTRSWRWSRLITDSQAQHIEDRLSPRRSQFRPRISQQLSPTVEESEGQRPRLSRFSQFSGISRPLSFNGSIWVKNPADIVIGFDFVDSFTQLQGSLDPPKHVFSRAKKKRLVYLVSLAAMFSPLSSNIYFPALDTIAQASFIPYWCSV